MADYDERPKHDPRVTPHFPCDSFTPFSKCPHKRKYKNGVRLACMVCNKSGVDHFRVLKRDPRTDPKPERLKAKAEKKSRKELRKQNASKPKPRKVGKLVLKAAAILGLA